MSTRGSETLSLTKRDYLRRGIFVSIGQNISETPHLVTASITNLNI